MHSGVKIKIMKYQIEAYSISSALSNYLIKLLECVPHDLLLEYQKKWTKPYFQGNLF